MTTFKPGVSGNPSGRPKGSLNKHTQLAHLIEDHAEALINKTVELALCGDPVALRLCIERLIPKKSEKSTVTMPDLSALETVKIIPELFKSLAGQEINFSDMKGLMDILRDHDNEIDRNQKNHLKLELTTDDPNEAARMYAQIMQGN
jgi:hypothetical protein